MSPIYALLLNRLINDTIILIDINGNNEDNSGEKWGEHEGWRVHIFSPLYNV